MAAFNRFKHIAFPVRLWLAARYLKNLLDKQQTIAQSTAAIHSAVGTYRGNRAKAAAEELEKQQADRAKVVNAWAKEMGWRIIPGGKYGSNNGFDHVFVTPTGQVVLADSKQIVKNAMHLIPSAAGGHMQMSNNWVRTVIGKLPKNNPTIPVLEKAMGNQTLHRTVMGITATGFSA